MIICGDALTELRKLPDESVQTCITSPPYYGLRDYGTAKWEGGDPACDHLEKSGGTKRSTLGAESGGNPMSDEARIRSTARSFVPAKDRCRKCGARRVDRQLGLEKTPREYVDKMVEVFREVRRVLRKDGTLWLNLGDSYAGSRAGGGGGSALRGTRRNQVATSEAKREMVISRRRDREPIPRSDYAIPGLKPKDLIGIPWRVAFALQEDGWYLRQDIIWHKPDAMPESAKDRCTKAYDYIFLMAKSRRYYYNAEAIREPAKFRNDAERNYVPSGWDTGPGAHKTVAHNTGTLKDRYDRSRGKFSETDRQSAGRRVLRSITKARDNGTQHDAPFGPFRNKRSVWTISTKGFIDAHFATFPTALIEPMILAGCPKGGTVLDPFCGAVTVGLVAAHLGREFIGIDLNPAYLEMGRKRINGNLFPEPGT